MSLALGRAGVTLGFVAALWGMLSMLVGIYSHNPRYLRIGPVVCGWGGGLVRCWRWGPWNTPC